MSDNNTDFQRTITRIALDACADAGFVLAGGSALREHGITNRPTADIDLLVLLQSWVENREHSFLRRPAGIMAQPA